MTNKELSSIKRSNQDVLNGYMYYFLLTIELLISASYLLLGNNTRTTICVDNDSSQTNGQVVSIAASSTSLLIESLIEQLCTMFESDTVRRNRLYFGNLSAFLKEIKFHILLLILHSVFFVML